MKVIIMCCGQGSRMRPLTYKLHKSLVHPGNSGFSILLNNIILLDNFFDIEEFIIVCNDKFQEKVESIYYESDLIRDYNVKFVKNIFAEEYNNSYTMLLGLEELKDSDEFLTLEGDVFLKEGIEKYISEAIKSKRPTYFASYRKHEWALVKNGQSNSWYVKKNCDGLCMAGMTYNPPYTSKLLREDIVDNSEYDKDFWDDSFVRVNQYCMDVVNVGKLLKEYDSIVDLLEDGTSPLSIAQDISEGDASPLDSMTNTNYLIKFNGDQKILRLPGLGTKEFINREREEFFTKLISKYGIVPNSEFYGKGVKVTDYIKDSRTSTPDDFSEVYKALSRLHSIKVQEYYPLVDLIKEIEDYEKLYSKDKIPSNYEEVSEFYKEFITEFQHTNCVICHRDMDPRNILLSPEGVKFIDLEYCGVMNRYWDLGCYISEAFLHFDYSYKYHQKEFDDAIKAYEYSSGVNVNKKEIVFWSGVVDYIWACWTIAKESCGEDFGDYFEKRWNRACRIKEDFMTGQ